ncbi:MAG: 2-C-methyl-D-erythritol 4-phosphate cytidylyltransferase [Clostridia bacterium]|nr:2-C-methyl-D-erythritol 4-phosphate cytidylyltransferase [Clostridia bacterium]
MKLLFNKHSFTSAIIVAGGTGSRMSSDIPKQHMTVDGIELVARTLITFESCALIDEIIVVCREGENDIYENYKQTYGITKLTRTVCGGATRQESVLCGFEAVDSRCKYVAIHDAVRCLIDVTDIENTLNAAYKYHAATAATRVYDTVKLADENGFISDTIDRDKVFLASTPQVFKHDLYMTAAYSAKKDGAVVTDDNALAERLGFKIKLVACEHPNIKITTPCDMETAKAIIESKKREI